LLNEHFDVEIVRAHGESDTIGALQSGDFDLVLINQKLDRDYNEGFSILETIKSDSAMSQIAVMLVSSFPETLESAMAAGAVCGVGKAEPGKPDVVQRLAAILGSDE
jgi:DNA-binding NarL/FixJ family response regulator